MLLLIFSTLLGSCIGTYDEGNNFRTNCLTAEDVQNAIATEMAVITARDRIASLVQLEREYSATGRFAEPGFEAILTHNVFQAPSPEVIRMDQLQWVFEEANQQLYSEAYSLSDGTAKTPLFLGRQANSAVQECTFETIVCDASSKYRTMDGSCNNLQNPDWGKAATCFQRLLPPNYGDGQTSLRLAQSGQSLPNPRDISVRFNTNVDKPSPYLSLMHVMFGQFLDHDITLTPLSRTVDNEPIQCCPVSEQPSNPQCAPIVVRESDPFYSHFNVTCINFARSARCAQCLFGPRQQINQITGFIDASQVYGNDDETSNSLRANTGDGTLIVAETQEAGHVLPPSLEPNNDQCSIPDLNQICFRAGDQRVNQQPPLVSLHLVFLRQHNRLARGLQRMNPNWNEEKLFQEARRIVVAQMQMIVYNEYLPLVVGNSNMKYFELTVENSYQTNYRPGIQPNIYNEFSTAAFRFGHSMISSYFPEIPESVDGDRGHLLQDLFEKPFEIYGGKLEPYIRGLLESKAQGFDRHMVPDVTNYLYRRFSNESGLDLASLNIQRGRDHGIPGFTQYVEFCRSITINTFEDLDAIMPAESRELLQSMYESVHDIDLFVGGLAETPEVEAIVGPVFACIISIQFYHLKLGDRFYFEHLDQTGSFSSKQLNEIKKTSLAKIICETTRIAEIQPLVMMSPIKWNPILNCGDLPDLDLEWWKE